MSPSDKIPELPESFSTTALGLSGLAAVLLASLARNVENRYYKGQTISLDGYTFRNCCFHNCNLETDNGTFAIVSCTFINCNVRFGPNAIRIIRLWNVFNVNQQWPFFNPLVAPDGAITIE